MSNVDVLQSTCAPVDLRFGCGPTVVLVNIRPKLSGAPLGYTLSLVEGTEVYKEFGKALWSDDGAIPATLKELVFIRTTIVNDCPT